MPRFNPYGRLIVAASYAAFLFTAACSSSPRVVASHDDTGPSAITFPDPAHASSPEGRFVNLENLQHVQAGMTKRELYALLGTPQFNEGVFGVKRWNYLFKFQAAGAVGNMRCQYQIVFDEDHHASAMYWKPAACRAVLDTPVQAIAVAAAPSVAAPAEHVTAMQPIRLSADALFTFDRAELTVQGRQNLSGLLQQVQQASRLQNILIIGYADRLGTEAHNLVLSKHRADAVARYLGAGGVSAQAMTSAGRGSEDPVVQCSNAKRKALIACLSPNRRVELSGAVDR